MWTRLKLKLEETSFFAGQLKACERHPKQFLFFLSAFLSSARSVTFHLQKQFGATGRAQYERLRDEMLADEIARYFLELRNHAEKRGYPPVTVSQLVARRDPQSGHILWTLLAQAHPFGPHGQPSRFGSLEAMLKHDWEVHGIGSTPTQIRYVWNFADYPGAEKEIATACSEFADRLWEFVFKFREIWEQDNDRSVIVRKLALQDKAWDEFFADDT